MFDLRGICIHGEIIKMLAHIPQPGEGRGRRGATSYKLHFEFPAIAAK